MKGIIKLVLCASFLTTTASLRAGSDAPDAVTIAPGGPLLLGEPAFAAPVASAREPSLLTEPDAADTTSSDDLGFYALTGTVRPAVDTIAPAAPSFATSSGAKASVPLPEPSSSTSLYVLSGLVGLACVVLRRRSLA